MTAATPSAEVVSTPTGTWLQTELAACCSHFLVASPFVGSGLTALVAHLRAMARTTVITRTDVVGFARGSSDLAALCAMASSGTRVLALADLHAKVYVVDGRVALVTSANATHRGMWHNLECGVAIREPRLVRQIRAHVMSGMGGQQPPHPWSADHLASLRPVVDALRRSLPPELRVGHVIADATTEAVAPVPDSAINAVGASLPGWTALVFESVCEMPGDEFSLDEVFEACAVRAARRYPRNRHVREKVRQRLQVLRDMGLLAFLGGARYARLLRSE